MDRNIEYAGICTCHSSHTSRPSHCPSPSERAPQKPTPICITINISFQLKEYIKIIAYPAAIYRCFVFDDDSKFAKFRSVKDKAFSKRLSLYNTSPTPPWPHELRYRREKHCKTMKIKLNILLYINIFTQMLTVKFLFKLRTMFNTIEHSNLIEHRNITLSFAIISISFVHSSVPTYR